MVESVQVFRQTVFTGDACNFIKNSILSELIQAMDASTSVYSFIIIPITQPASNEIDNPPNQLLFECFKFCRC